MTNLPAAAPAETPMMAPPAEEKVMSSRDDNLSMAISQFRARANVDREAVERKQAELEDRAAFMEAMKEPSICWLEGRCRWC